jgi:hypothetical protein
MAPSRLSMVSENDTTSQEAAPPAKWAPSGAMRSKQPPSTSSISASQSMQMSMQSSSMSHAVKGQAPSSSSLAPSSSPLPHELLSIMARKAATSSSLGAGGGGVKAPSPSSDEKANAPPLTIDSSPLLTPHQHAKLQGLSECLSALESLSKESERLLNHTSTLLSPLVTSTTPLLSQSSLLLRAGRNIEGTKSSLHELLSFLETSHKVEASLRAGPRGYRGDLDSYLGHLAALDQAIQFLEAHSQLASAQEAYSHSLQVRSLRV